MGTNQISQPISIKKSIRILHSAGKPNSDTALQDAQVLLANILKQPRTYVLAHPEVILSLEQSALVEEFARKLTHGMPLPYLLGYWEFYGREFIISPDVLIPRPETELLVEEAYQWLRSHPAAGEAADVGTGSGIFAVSLALEIPGLQITAVDISPVALEIARQNAEKHKVLDRIRFLQNDLLDGTNRTFDLIAANLPYIPTRTMQKLPVSRHEPKLALDGGEDGLDLIRRLLEQSVSLLASPGLMLLEFEYRQGVKISQAAAKHFPAAGIRIIKDLSGHDRILAVERT